MTQWHVYDCPACKGWGLKMAELDSKPLDWPTECDRCDGMGLVKAETVIDGESGTKEG